MNPAADPAPTLKCEPGRAWPMGACCTEQRGSRGVNFAVYSRHASAIELCLFDPSGTRETQRFFLPACSNGVWHGFVAGLVAGQLYGLRAHGPYQPQRGQRFNPAKLLVDPFARALVGDTSALSLELDYLGQPGSDVVAWNPLPDPADNAARIPKAQVLDHVLELQAGAAIGTPPRVPAAQTVLYEAHVKGLTQRHPEVPSPLRGCYAGVVSAPMLAHYKRLGITTVCLLPVQQHITEMHLLKKGLRNYWGYNTLGYFVPEPSYASGQHSDVRAEFRHMVDQLHRNGIEVVLDVVYNHSAESDAFGPTLSWRGLDNASWYAIDGVGQYLNFSGCGNSFNLAHPCGLQLVMDSLRWWVQAFGVDGFRFDLATALGRDPAHQYSFQFRSALLSAIGQDPVLAGVKCIAEPWDVGPQGYQLGQFPPPWLEWNDRFRDACRAFWLGHACSRGELARRFTASSDFFDRDGRSPLASVNLITAHDGMTLADLTSYAQRHNELNGENNADGHHNNLSSNAGVEGPSEDETVLAVRGQWRRALLATLLCSQGTPQLLAGDEFGHTQGGNNNAYCQDNDTGWLDWSRADTELADFVTGLVHLRRSHAALRHARWFAAEPRPGASLTWRNPDGSALTDSDWHDPHSRSLACLMEVADEDGALTERWYWMFHASAQACTFALPPGTWVQAVDSAAARVLPQADWAMADAYREQLTLAPRTLSALVQSVKDPGRTEELAFLSGGAAS